MQEAATGAGKPEYLAIADYTQSSDPHVPDGLDIEATLWHAGGRVTSLCLAEPASRGADTQPVTVLSGSAGGQVSAIVVQVPQLAGAGLEDVEVRSSLRFNFTSRMHVACPTGRPAVCCRRKRCRFS